MRTLTRQARDLLESRIHALIVAQAQSFDVSAEIEYRRVYPVLVDWPEPTRFGGEMALALVGAERCNVSAAASTASDDIAFLLEKSPAGMSSSETETETVTGHAWSTTRGMTLTTRTL
jgi:hippurate hydrolase